jgi:hypothetical protein
VGAFPALLREALKPIKTNRSGCRGNRFFIVKKKIFLTILGEYAIMKPSPVGKFIMEVFNDE